MSQPFISSSAKPVISRPFSSPYQASSLGCGKSWGCPLSLQLDGRELSYPRYFFPLNPIHALNILLAEMQLFLGTKLVILLLRSKKKAEKCWNMMIFFQNQENAGERGSIAALRELSQPDQERQSIFLENKVNDFST